MKNKLGLLGLLGLLGIVGFFNPNKVYFSFFAFLYFGRYFFVIPDELFKENVKRAATPAFFTGLVIYLITAALTAFSISAPFYIAGLVLGFVASFLVFTTIFIYLEQKESQE